MDILLPLRGYKWTFAYKDAGSSITNVEDDRGGEGEGGKRDGAGGAKRAGRMRCGPYD